MRFMTPVEKRNMFGPSWMQKLQAANAPLDNAWNWARGEPTPYQRFMRKALNYRGDGDYLKGGFVGKNKFAAMGMRALGAGGAQLLGMPAPLGALAGGMASKWAGFGDYGPVVHNQIAGGEGGPITVNASDNLTGDVYISHKEFVGNVQCSAAAAGASSFQQTSYELNPGLAASFPFLSQLASNFELYDFQGLMYEYRPTSGENATANSLGKVMMATQYDPDASPFLNSVQLQNYDYSASCKPSVGMVHGVETAQSQQAVNMMFIRTGNSTKAKTFTDLGYLTVATEGIPFTGAGTQILGELWVTYRIKLSRANLYNSLLGLSQPLDYFSGVSTAAAAAGTPNKAREANAGLWSITASTTSSITLSAKTSLIAGCFQYVLYLYEATPATAVSAAATTLIANVTEVQQRGAAGLGTQINAGKLSIENVFMGSGYIEVNNTNGVAPSFRLNFSAIPAGLTYTLSIGQVPCSIKNAAGTTTLQ